MTPEEALTFVTARKTDYAMTFATPHGQRVLADLAPFCRAKETCVVAGDRDRTLILEGRREVFLRVQDHLERTPDELVAIYTRPATGATSHARPDPSDPST